MEVSYKLNEQEVKLLQVIRNLRIKRFLDYSDEYQHLATKYPEELQSFFKCGLLSKDRQAIVVTQACEHLQQNLKELRSGDTVVISGREYGLFNCSYYQKTFDTIDQLVADVMSSGMDPSYTISRFGKDTGESLMEYINP